MSTVSRLWDLTFVSIAVQWGAHVDSYCLHTVVKPCGYNCVPSVHNDQVSV